MPFPIGLLLPLLAAGGIAAGTSMSRKKEEKDAELAAMESDRKDALRLFEGAQSPEELIAAAKMYERAGDMGMSSLVSNRAQSMIQQQKQQQTMNSLFMNLIQGTMGQGQVQGQGQGQEGQVQSQQGMQLGAPTKGPSVIPKASGFQHEGVLATAAQKYGVPMALAKGLIGTESGFRHYDDKGNVLTNPASGAHGYGQFIPGTSKEMKQKYGLDTMDPEQNLVASMAYLRELNDKTGGDWEKTLAFYGGYGGDVEKAQGYIGKVMGDKKAEPGVLPPAYGNLNKMRGITATMNSKGDVNFNVDFSKMMYPEMDQVIAETYAALPDDEKQMFGRALLEAKAFGSEPVEIVKGTDVSTGRSYVDRIRKRDGAFLGRTWQEGQEKLTPGQQVTQAEDEATAAKRGAMLGEAATRLQPVPGEASGKPMWEVEAKQEADRRELIAKAEAGVKREVDAVGAKKALDMISSYSKQIHTSEGVGRVLQGFTNYLSAAVGDSAAKSYRDYSKAFLGQLARIYSAERGVLSKQDVAFVENLVPGLFSGKTFAMNRMKELHDFLNDMDSRPTGKAGEWVVGNVYPGKNGTYGVYEGKDENGKDKWSLLWAK